MSLTQLVAARLKLKVSGLGMVGDAADLASIRRETLQFPAAFVVLLADKGGQNGLNSGNSVSQRREQRLGVVLAVRNIRSGQGADALHEIDALRQQVDAALIGWQPGTGDTYDPVLFSAGKLLDMSNGEMWWQDEYLTAYQYWKANS